MSNWISVADQLPAENEDVLGHLDSGLITVISRNGEGWIYEFDDSRVGVPVTHWMPLPSPPFPQELGDDDDDL